MVPEPECIPIRRSSPPQGMSHDLLQVQCIEYKHLTSLDYMAELYHNHLHTKLMYPYPKVSDSEADSFQITIVVACIATAMHILLYLKYITYNSYTFSSGKDHPQQE